MPVSKVRPRVQIGTFLIFFSSNWIAEYVFGLSCRITYTVLRGRTECEENTENFISGCSKCVCFFVRCCGIINNFMRIARNAGCEVSVQILNMGDLNVSRIACVPTIC